MLYIFTLQMGKGAPCSMADLWESGARNMRLSIFPLLSALKKLSSQGHPGPERSPLLTLDNHSPETPTSDNKTN